MTNEEMMVKYAGNDNNGRPKSEYVERVNKLERAFLIDETKQAIWLSGCAANNSRSDYHWHVDACYDELVKRDGNADEYAKCYDYVVERL
jgi:hypothetical protein